MSPFPYLIPILAVTEIAKARLKHKITILGCPNIPTYATASSPKELIINKSTNDNLTIKSPSNDDAKQYSNSFL